MRARSFAVFLLFVMTAPHFTGAASACRGPVNPTDPFGTTNKVITFYVPHGAPNCQNSIEGCIETSCPNLVDSKRVPVCLDDVRKGRAKYVTLASAEENYGKFFNIGTVTYRSAEDDKMYTLRDVVGFVHDTGCAFNGTCKTGNFSKVPRPDKIDVCTTICTKCTTDAQAGAYASGKNVDFTPGGGPADFSSVNENNAQRFPGWAPQQINSLLNQPRAMQYQQGVPALSQYGATQYSSPTTAVTTSSGASDIDQLASKVSASLGIGGATGSSGSSATTQVIGTPVGDMFVSPQSAVRGSKPLVIWTTLNMKNDTPCKVKLDDTQVGQGNSGTQALKTDALAVGAHTLTLSCVKATGEAFTKTDTLTLQ